MKNAFFGALQVRVTPLIKMNSMAQICITVIFCVLKALLDWVQ